MCSVLFGVSVRLLSDSILTDTPTDARPRREDSALPPLVDHDPEFPQLPPEAAPGPGVLTFACSRRLQESAAGNSELPGGVRDRRIGFHGHRGDRGEEPARLRRDDAREVQDDR